MSEYVLKFSCTGDGKKEHVKLFRNEKSCDKFINEKKVKVISKSVDNRARKTIKRLMNIPKRKTW